MPSDAQRDERPNDEDSGADEMPAISPFAALSDWLRNQAPWWAASGTAHMAGLALLLLLGRVIIPTAGAGDVGFVNADVAPHETAPPVEPAIVDPGPPDLDYKKLSTVDLTNIESPPGGRPDAEGPAIGPPTDPTLIPSGSVTDTGTFGGVERPGDGPGTSKGMAPGGKAAGGAGGALGGSGGNGHGATRESDNAIIAALSWFKRHQMRDGSWSLQDYTKMCTDKSCTGPADLESRSAATAMGILPFIAAGQTHLTNGPNRQTIAQGIYWLENHQRADGDLSADASGKQSWMYSHGLATIALGECYALSHDKNVGRAAQNAVNFIQAAQNTKTGGWRYQPGDEGDTSVLGWQMMALKSAQMAGLAVNPATFEGTKRWLRSVADSGAASTTSSGSSSGEFSYQPGSPASPTMSAVGLLCTQYLHAGKNDPVIVGGVRYLMANLPSAASPNVYYWYYASQAMHNMDDHDWDVWNRRMRKILVESQSRQGCSTGSWDPDRPNRDAWGAQGGRMMTTSFATLTLEVYYRIMPLYHAERPEDIR